LNREPELTIQLSRRGVERVLVRMDDSAPDSGMSLLQKVLPAVEALDRETRSAGRVKRKGFLERTGS
jgi:hypothetical protein